MLRTHCLQTKKKPLVPCFVGNLKYDIIYLLLDIFHTSSPVRVKPPSIRVCRPLLTSDTMIIFNFWYDRCSVKRLLNRREEKKRAMIWTSNQAARTQPSPLMRWIGIATIARNACTRNEICEKNILFVYRFFISLRSGP